MRLPQLAAPGLGFLIASLLATPALATDVYVDVVNGSNANGGTSPSDAWQTIEHAFNQLGSAPAIDRVLLLPGTYGPLEPQDLFLRDGMRLVGLAGPDETILEAQLHVGLGGVPTGPITGGEGFAFEGGNAGIRMTPSGPSAPRLQASFRDMRFTDGLFPFDITLEGASSVGSSFVLEDSEIVSLGNFGSPYAGSVRASNSADVQVDLRRVNISTRGGILAIATTARVRLNLQHTAIRMNAPLQHGVDCLGQGVQLHIADCAITDFCLSTWGIEASGPTLVERSTITGHDYGIFLKATATLTVRDSIVADNTQDIWDEGGIGADITNCLIDDPLYTGLNGNFAAPPRFVSPHANDYRLRFDSPCIDRVASTAGFDIRGLPRNVDGDLDTIPRGDLGAFELQTLSAPAEVDLGAPLEVAVQGPAGELARLFGVRGDPLAAPLMTPFGGLLLDPARTVALATTVTNGGLATPFGITAPTAAALSGSTLSFQALVRSGLAPSAAAYSNAVEVLLR